MLSNIQKSKVVPYSAIGAIVGICLITFVTEPLSNNKNNNAEVRISTAVFNTYPAKDTSLQTKRIDRTPQEPTISITKACEKRCLNLIFKLETGEKLSAQDIAFIIKNASVFANSLASEPDAMANLLTALQGEETNKVNQHDAAYAIVDALSLEQKVSVASLISTSIDPNDRVSALKLLQSGIKNDEQAVDVFLSILTDEYDTRVKVMAINMTRQISGEHNQEKTRQVLDNIIQSTYSSYTSGEALIAKILISPSSSFVAQDINDFVSNDSVELQEYGLQAIETSMERYNAEFDAGHNQQERESIQASVQAITRDEYVSTDIRNQAQDILERFF